MLRFDMMFAAHFNSKTNNKDREMVWSIFRNQEGPERIFLKTTFAHTKLFQLTFERLQYFFFMRVTHSTPEYCYVIRVESIIFSSDDFKAMRICLQIYHLTVRL